MNTSIVRGLIVVGALSVASPGRAATYQVGPTRQYQTIQEVLGVLAPGDVVEVDGDHTYPGDIWFEPEHSGTAGQPVTIRGLRVNGKRPTIQGVGSEQWHDMTVFFHANHFVFEGFEIVGDGNEEHNCLVHKADDVTIRDVLVRDCVRHGLLGTDSESGSLTLENCEFYGNGNGLYRHQIYMATDETAYPGSVFRLQHCYIHDGNGGNNVKSRAERNEIYFNWIEGAVYHELDLIGPDGQAEGLAREDSDVVGNVLIKTSSEWRIARIGGDGTGTTNGRYRFVHNTVVLSEQADLAFGVQDALESLEVHNNVFWRHGGQPGRIVHHTEPSGPDPALIGSQNWVQDGWTDVPTSWTGTMTGAAAGFEDMAGFDFRPTETSVLVDQGTSETASSGAHAFPSPLVTITHVPPPRTAVQPGAEAPRPDDGAADVGAYEYGSSSPPPVGGSGQGGSGQGAGAGQGGGQGGSDDGDGSGRDRDDDGCGCKLPRGGGQAGVGRGASWLVLGLPLLGLGLRRRREGSLAS